MTAEGTVGAPTCLFSSSFSLFYFLFFTGF
jgi:hypothetical protein